MDPVIQKIFDPSIVWVFIPLLAILCWGVIGVVRALRGEPEDFEQWKAELQQLRTRVEQLEKTRHGTHLGATDVHVVKPNT